MTNGIKSNIPANSKLNSMLSTNKKEAAPSDPEPETQVEEPKKEGRMFQHYSSAKSAMQMITEKGKKIKFVSYQFITDDEDIIEYLNTEIKGGLRDITKGKLMSLEEANPMVAIRRQHFIEFQEEQERQRVAEALGEERNMGETNEGKKSPLGAASTKQIVNASGSSSESSS